MRKNRVVTLSHPPAVVSFANIGGKLESQGPLRDRFDELCQDSFFGQKTWEQGEAQMQKQVLQRALDKAGLTPEDLDYVLAGDLGELGHAIVADFFARDGMDLGDRYQDCGLLLYDRQQQDMHAGASGCGCSASVLNGYILPGMREGRCKRVLFAPTGALLSPTSSFQGESIPGICHAVCFSTEKDCPQ